MYRTSCVMCARVSEPSELSLNGGLCNRCFCELTEQLDPGILEILNDELLQGNSIERVCRTDSDDHTVIDVELEYKFKGIYAVDDKQVKHTITKQVQGARRCKTGAYTTTAANDGLASSVSHKTVETISPRVSTSGEPDLMIWAEVMIRTAYLFAFNLGAFLVFIHLFPELNLFIAMAASVIGSLAVFISTFSNVQSVGIRKWQDNRTKVRNRAIRKEQDNWLHKH